MAVFDKEQWRWRRDSEWRNYLFVDNRVLVHSLNGSVREVYAVIPSNLFLLLRTVLPESAKLALGSVSMKISVWEVRKGKWLLTLSVAGGEGEYDYVLDLWPYTDATMPAWLVDGA